MSVNQDESAAKAPGVRSKSPLQTLRERRGGVPESLRRLIRRNAALRKAIIDALSDGPKIVPEIAETSGLPADQIFWRLMAMKKYGEIVEGEERDDYFEYQLKASGETR